MTAALPGSENQAGKASDIFLQIRSTSDQGPTHTGRTSLDRQGTSPRTRILDSYSQSIAMKLDLGPTIYKSKSSPEGLLTSHSGQESQNRKLISQGKPLPDLPYSIADGLCWPKQSAKLPSKAVHLMRQRGGLDTGQTLQAVTFEGKRAYEAREHEPLLDSRAHQSRISYWAQRKMDDEKLGLSQPDLNLPQRPDSATLPELEGTSIENAMIVRQGAKHFREDKTRANRGSSVDGNLDTISLKAFLGTSQDDDDIFRPMAESTNNFAGYEMRRNRSAAGSQRSAGSSQQTGFYRETNTCTNVTALSTPAITKASPAWLGSRERHHKDHVCRHEVLESPHISEFRRARHPDSTDQEISPHRLDINQNPPFTTIKDSKRNPMFMEYDKLKLQHDLLKKVSAEGTYGLRDHSDTEPMTTGGRLATSTPASHTWTHGDISQEKHTLFSFSSPFSMSRYGTINKTKTTPKEKRSVNEVITSGLARKRTAETARCATPRSVEIERWLQNDVDAAPYLESSQSGPKYKGSGRNDYGMSLKTASELASNFESNDQEEDSAPLISRPSTRLKPIKSRTKFNNTCKLFGKAKSFLEPKPDMDAPAKIKLSLRTDRGFAGPVVTGPTLNSFPTEHELEMATTNEAYNYIQKRSTTSGELQPSSTSSSMNHSPEKEYVDVETANMALAKLAVSSVDFEESPPPSKPFRGIVSPMKEHKGAEATKMSPSKLVTKARPDLPRDTARVDLGSAIDSDDTVFDSAPMRLPSRSRSVAKTAEERAAAAQQLLDDFEKLKAARARKKRQEEEKKEVRRRKRQAVLLAKEKERASERQFWMESMWVEQKQATKEQLKRERAREIAQEAEEMDMLLRSTLIIERQLKALMKRKRKNDREFVQRIKMLGEWGAELEALEEKVTSHKGVGYHENGKNRGHGEI